MDQNLNPESAICIADVYFFMTKVTLKSFSFQYAKLLKLTVTQMGPVET